MSVQILTGDCRAVLRTLAAESVDCVVTSPPYWGLRDYGVAGQLGLEPTLGEHIATMVDVFRDVRRVLKTTGTLWLNYGDCYATSPNGRSAADTKAAGNDDRTFRDKPFSTIGGVLKAKDLCMVPNRLAIALQEDGWWVRSEIIWGKRNPMPESIKDRPSTAHEKIWLLSKSARYFYDTDAVRRDYAPATIGQITEDYTGQDTKDYAAGGAQSPSDTKRRIITGMRAKTRGLTPRHTQENNHTGIDAVPRGEGRSLRNYEPAPVGVWDMATRPFPDAHFATFPPELAERCIKAGCPEDGTVLDPFGGAGTTALVADRLQRNAILIELNPAYATMAAKRIKDDGGLFSALEGEAAA